MGMIQRMDVIIIEDTIGYDINIVLYFHSIRETQETCLEALISGQSLIFQLIIQLRDKLRVYVRREDSVAGLHF